MLNFNNRLAALQSRLDEAETAAVKWESNWTRRQSHAANRTLLLGRVTMYDLFHYCDYFIYFINIINNAALVTAETRDCAPSGE